MTSYPFLVLLGVEALSLFKCCSAFLTSPFDGGTVLMFKSELVMGILGTIGGSGLFRLLSTSLHLFSCSF